ncbi:RDD family protein [Dokdonella sp.]|uniref:RDD family protein n=1 Tax=Dokdonella sp. TaxID=2291710 RepID=UPI0037849D18
MDSTINPYKAPTSRVAEQSADAGMVPAERWRRFVNLLVDYFGFMALAFVVGIVIGIVGGNSAVEAMQNIGVQYLFGFLVMFAYYVPLELFFGRTLGKLVTGTRVVDENGEPPSAGKVIGRTLCRFIPFEAFSFFASDARGWHDSIPKTYVVKIR